MVNIHQGQFDVKGLQARREPKKSQLPLLCRKNLHVHGQPGEAGDLAERREGGVSLGTLAAPPWRTSPSGSHQHSRALTLSTSGHARTETSCPCDARCHRQTLSPRRAKRGQQGLHGVRLIATACRGSPAHTSEVGAKQQTLAKSLGLDIGPLFREANMDRLQRDYKWDQVTLEVHYASDGPAHQVEGALVEEVEECHPQSRRWVRYAKAA